MLKIEPRKVFIIFCEIKFTSYVTYWLKIKLKRYLLLFYKIKCTSYDKNRVKKSIYQFFFAKLNSRVMYVNYFLTCPKSAK